MYHLTDSFEVAAGFSGRENGRGSFPLSNYKLKQTLSIVTTPIPSFKHAIVHFHSAPPPSGG